MNKSVVIICPTYNRHYFLPFMIYMVNYQDYPKDLLQLLIIDDSDSKYDIKNLEFSIDFKITYIYSDIKLSLGRKRNLLNKHALELGADIIVCFDDDDYYPSNRVSYCVNTLISNNHEICGSSGLLIYFPKLDKIYLNGPFNNSNIPGHSCNGVLAYTKSYLDKYSYNDNDNTGEERFFLNNYKNRLFQMDYMKTMLCICHSSNTINKNKIISSSTLTNLKITDIVKDEILLNFYNVLKIYD